ncbi:MAG: hypothetical protein M3R15_04620 [Acidobacteriota bacterium]|nr:hypothetical protein [Acidobacteriota bacterium]
MFVLQSKEQISNAINNAKALHPKVRMVCFGRYEVSASKTGYYTVRCFRNRGQKVVDCNCKAGENGMPCKHAAVALPLHIHMAQSVAATL